MCNESLVYLNKIFSNEHGVSCPIMTSIVTTPDKYTQKLTFYNENKMNTTDGCSCSCTCNCGYEAANDMTFVIDSAKVLITDFEMVNPNCLTTDQVTVNGINVDDLMVFNKRFIAATKDLMAQISNCSCTEKGLPTAGFFLVEGAGPWKCGLTFLIEGTAFGCGACKQFKLCLSSKKNVFIPLNSTNTFPVSCISMPCTVDGIAPEINFSFDATSNLLNPSVTADDESGQCNLILSGKLIVTPTIEVEVTRQTLFKTNDQLVSIPCDDLALCSSCGNDCDSSSCDTEKEAKKISCCQYNGYNGCSF